MTKPIPSTVLKLAAPLLANLLEDRARFCRGVAESTYGEHHDGPVIDKLLRADTQAHLREELAEVFCVDDDDDTDAVARALVDHFWPGEWP